MKSKISKTAVLLAFSLFFSFFISGAEIVKAPAEEIGYSQYSQYEEITAFLSRVSHLSEKVKVQIIGRTKDTEAYASRDLYLCIITEEGADSPLKLNRKKPTFLLVASQHGREQSAKEATLLFIRDLATGKLESLMKRINFLIIPQANPYGNFFDQRRNEQDLDLNRDHVKLEAPEVEAIHHVFRAWMPEVTMDVHEKGDDFYRVSIGCVSNANIHQSLQEFSRSKILTEVWKKLEKKRITHQEYLITQHMGIDSSAGVRYPEEYLKGREEMKRYSTTDLNDGRNSLGIYETLSFIQEGASRHDLKTLRKRTNYQYDGIRYFAESVAAHGEEIISLVNGLRKKLLAEAKVFSEDDLVHLRMEYARDEKEPELTIQKFEPIDASIEGVLKVDKKAGDIITRDDMATYRYPSEQEVVKEVVTNWFPNVEPTLSVPRPLGYIIPAKYHDIVETLFGHDIKVEMFTKDIHLEIESYQTKGIVPAIYDYLPPQKIEVEKKKLQTIIKRGDFYVSCAQWGAKLIPCLLEPQSQYGFIRYWKFKLVPEAGDIFAFYRFVGKKALPLIPYKNWQR
ncbi:MAG: DUF2817 domain-containing protein [Candidatus Aminicenantes bacterium]|nr:DUF2817 domain-containing protein [Candidatus Aminicenantes bacterium]